MEGSVGYQVQHGGWYLIHVSAFPRGPWNCWSISWFVQCPLCSLSWPSCWGQVRALKYTAVRQNRCVLELAGYFTVFSTSTSSTLLKRLWWLLVSSNCRLEAWIVLLDNWSYWQVCTSSTIPSHSPDTEKVVSASNIVASCVVRNNSLRRWPAWRVL